MSSEFFKVIFKGSRKFEIKKLSLVFKSMVFDKPINVPSHFFLNIKKLSKTNSDIVFFQNIDEVIKFGDQISSYDFTNYSVVLYISKSTGNKEGLLIGRTKTSGELVIGIWPFNRETSGLSVKKLFESCEDLIKNTQKYSSICLIN